MDASFDIAIVGSGFAGSLLAMVARRLGRSVVLLERGVHPRFAIGESSTPLANLVLEELATTYDLPRLLPLAKWGSWRRVYPRLACGLKRGFTFCHHRAGHRFEGRADHSDQLLVAASPNDHIGDTHWYRAEFDEFLVREAAALGATYLDHAEVQSVESNVDGAVIHLTRRGARSILRTRWLFDATGPGGFIRNQFGIKSSSFPGFPPTRSLYTHFSGVSDVPRIASASPSAELPFPPDHAAVHHVFDGGWVWSLRFNNGLTSAGIMATDHMADELKLLEGEPAWGRLLRRFPTLLEIFGEARAVRPFIYAPSIAFRAARASGPGWTLLPSAAGFVDPLLSTGFPLTLLGIHRLATILRQDWGSNEWLPRLEEYSRATLAELDATALLVRSLYHSMSDFDRFAPLTLLYFAAASFSEAARRLNRPELAGGFLLHDHPTFGPAMRRCCERAICRASAGALSLADEVKAAILPIDIAGLGRSDRANWYPADARDTLAAADKLGGDVGAIEAMLRRCGL
jgi:FADH2 O2-dependent halogenase